MVVSEESPDTELRFLCLLRPGDVDEEGVGCMPARAKVGRRDRGRGPSQILREDECVIHSQEECCVTPHSRTATPMTGLRFQFENNNNNNTQQDNHVWICFLLSFVCSSLASQLITITIMFPIPVFIAPSEDRGPLPAIPYNPDSDISEPSEVAANPTSEAKEDIKKDTEEEPTKPRRVIRNEIAHPLHPIYELSHLEAYKNCVRDIVKGILVSPTVFKFPLILDVDSSDPYNA